MKHYTFILFLFSSFFLFAQEKQNNHILKKIFIKSDTIKIDTVSISPFYFKLFDENKKTIDSAKYSIDYSKSILIIKDTLLKNKELNFEYQKLPSFLTKTYKAFEESLIVNSTTNLSRLYRSNNVKKINYFKPFDGLNTNGSISRGITIGNNQDGVLNSNFDLQISGNLGKNVKIRANITDNNVPLQDNGYTQRLNEFDRVFIELYSKKWKVTAGDIDFRNELDHFLRFDKKVSGLSLETSLNHKNSKTDLFTSAALVRGRFAKIDFQGQEANQGPYRLTSVNESFLLIISGSEIVYIDGLPLKRGESNDYMIDYNLAEITFNTIFPITSNMRIYVEFQVSDQNFTRFITFNTANYQSDKLKLKVNAYSESDAKNQSLQQNLSNEQLQVLNNAGDDTAQMVTQSAIQEAFAENKIQYKKEVQDDVTFFVFSNDENEELYAVKFSLVGQNQGDYIIQNTIATGRVYEYVFPLNGIKQGDYAPIFQLIAPNKLQIVNFQTDYNPSKKTQLHVELAHSINDQNLFSNIDDINNDGYAGKLNFKQVLIDKPWQLSSFIALEIIDQDFNTIERLNNVEFERDWNLQNPIGNQNNFIGGFSYKKDSIGSFNYRFNNLEFNTNFKGRKHEFNTDLKYKNIHFVSVSSALNSDSNTEETTFKRSYNTIKYNFKKAWFGGNLLVEENIRKNKKTQQLTNLSHKFFAYDAFVGVGDSTKIFAEIGYNFRTNDSLKISNLEQVSMANTYYIKSSLLNNKKTNLGIFVNYRIVYNTNFEDEESLNTRLNYRQQLFNSFVDLNTVFETSNGALPQQDFNYIEVEPGQGFYTWIDYNEDGIQDLEEFEIAQFQDQAIYLRVLLPSTQFIRTNKNKFSQALNINFSKWSNNKGFKKTLSHFISQTTVLIDNKQNQEDKLININPFNISSPNILALNFNFRNSLFFNRGKQKYSTTYSVFNIKNRTVFVTGNQENNILTNQLQLQHKLNKFWLLDLKGVNTINESVFESFVNRNFNLLSNNFETKISYLHNKNTILESFYIFKEKKNEIGNLETLTSNNIGINFQYSKDQKLSLNTTFSMVENVFEGNQNSPVAFQMLEGLQDGRNFTWNLLLQKRLTSYLDLNLNYNGRKSESSKIIHVGSIQLRANF
ncbi:MAG: hypothetical protein L3J23_05575 [Flavobacteriaceae bacterium]|nr:hypothetical protein [Flavobacteriaceae bacterium]